MDISKEEVDAVARFMQGPGFFHLERYIKTRVQQWERVSEEALDDSPTAISEHFKCIGRKAELRDFLSEYEAKVEYDLAEINRQEQEARKSQ
jgi:hypothetical protein